MRTLSLRMLAAINDESTDEVPLFLMRGYAPGSNPADGLHIANAEESVISRGEEYLGVPFDIVLPDDDGKNLPTVNLVLDNVSQALAESILSLNSPQCVEIELVLDATRDVVEAGPWQFTTGAATINASTITMELRYEDILNEPFPSVRMTPQNFPSVFSR